MTIEIRDTSSLFWKSVFMKFSPKHQKGANLATPVDVHTVPDPLTTGSAHASRRLLLPDPVISSRSRSRHELKSLPKINLLVTSLVLLFHPPQRLIWVNYLKLRPVDMVCHCRGWKIVRLQRSSASKGRRASCRCHCQSQQFPPAAATRLWWHDRRWLSPGVLHRRIWVSFNCACA